MNEHCESWKMKQDVIGTNPAKQENRRIKWCFFTERLVQAAGAVPSPAGVSRLWRWHLGTWGSMIPEGLSSLNDLTYRMSRFISVCIRAILDGHEEETILILLISPQADMKR